MFPNVVINAKIHHGSIALTAGDLGTQNVDVVVVCSTSEILLKNILDQAGTAAFPALGYGLANCPADVVAKAIIDAAIKLTLQLTSKQEVNFKKCRSDIKSHLKSCSQVKGRDNEEKIDSWTQQSVLKFYKYCLNHNIWPTINLDQREVTLTGEKNLSKMATNIFLN
ncbi:unnamed protein product [Rotaria socialis]|uniref:Uncharacterized protein n=1 Tax=Rotaria socialis TaxID=392032 RepID=A0A817ZV88_9BILA|nr:unnamed protein product [Rotaria socialis]